MTADGPGVSHRRYATGSIAGSALAVAAFCWMITGGTWDFLQTGLYTDFYDAQARALRCIFRTGIRVVVAARGEPRVLSAWRNIEERDVLFEKSALKKALGGGFGFGKGLKPSCNDQRHEDLREAFVSMNRVLNQ